MSAASTTRGYAQADELRSRILFTLAILLLWRLLAWVPLPGLSLETVGSLMRGGQAGLANRIGVTALGLTPFMAAWAMTELARGWFAGATLDAARRYLTAVLAAVQALGLAVALEGVSGAVEAPGWGFRLTVVASLTGGTMTMLWLGEQITRRGLGDGVWMLVAAPMVMGLPQWFASARLLLQSGQVAGPAVALTVAASLALVVVIVGIETAERRIPVSPESAGHGAERIVLRIDNVTILPATLAALLLLVPSLLASIANALVGRVDWLNHLGNALLASKALQLATIAVLIVLLTVVLTAIVARPREIAARMRRDGASIAGESAEQSARYIDAIVERLTAIAVPYLAVVSVAPEALAMTTGIVPPLTGVQLLVVVLVALRVLLQVRRIVRNRATSAAIC